MDTASTIEINPERDDQLMKIALAAVSAAFDSGKHYTHVYRVKAIKMAMEMEGCPVSALEGVVLGINIETAITVEYFTRGISIFNAKK